MIGRSGSVIWTFPTHDVQTVTKYEYELPEEQEHLIEIVKEVAFKVWSEVGDYRCRDRWTFLMNLFRKK